jgi:chemotaxis methyl-accepting protein methylase
VKISAFKKISDGLAPGGFLIIGSHEKIPFLPQNFESFGSLSFVYQKTME